MVRPCKPARWVHPTAVLLPAGPACWLVFRGLSGRLGANPVEAITHVTGEWCLNLLLAALAVTPVRKLTGYSELTAVRKPLGLWAFAYGGLHLGIYLWLDQFFDFNAILKDVAKRPFITAGTAAFLLMVPLAATSSRSMIRRLGRRWRQIHALVYPAALLGIIHFWWLVKVDITRPAAFLAVFILLMSMRLRRTGSGS